MVKQKIKKKKPAQQPTELDGIYILKIVLYLIIGAQWVRLTDAAMAKQLPLPVGLVVGGFFAAHDHFQIDRKIEYAVLALACLLGFWTQIGIYISVLH